MILIQVTLFVRVDRKEKIIYSKGVLNIFI